MLTQCYECKVYSRLNIRLSQDWKYVFLVQYMIQIDYVWLNSVDFKVWNQGNMLKLCKFCKESVENCHEILSYTLTKDEA